MGSMRICIHHIVQNGGLFAIIKPTGVTSACVVDKLKPILFPGSKPRSKLPMKLGHGGTLDKNASGVLVIGLGSGTKRLKSMLHGNKKYKVTGCLGAATDTMDARGKVIETALCEHIKRQDIENILHQFRGDILQVPPIYSALKINGQRMSDLAIQGKPVKPKPARPVVVHSLSCCAFELPYFELDVACGGGFYVRSLVNDLGHAVGSCAHVTELCRTQQGPFIWNHAIKEADWTIENISKAIVDSSKYFIDEADTR